MSRKETKQELLFGNGEWCGKHPLTRGNGGKHPLTRGNGQATNKLMCSLGEMPISRPVHGSIWVGFVPNPEPTRSDWMARISTRPQPKWLIRSGGSHLQRMAVGSVRVGDLKIGQNSAS